MSELKRNQIGFLVALINEFAKRFSLTDRQSFEYISRYGGPMQWREFFLRERMGRGSRCR